MVIVHKTINAFTVTYGAGEHDDRKLIDSINRSGFAVAEKRTNYFTGTVTLIVNDNSNLGIETLEETIHSL